MTGQLDEDGNTNYCTIIAVINLGKNCPKKLVAVNRCSYQSN